jgi:hypothetical protein
VRQEREKLRDVAEDARRAAEDARHATIATVPATADRLSTTLAPQSASGNAHMDEEVDLTPGYGEELCTITDETRPAACATDTPEQAYILRI